VLKGAGNFGLFMVYVMSRKGSSGWLDMSQAKVCGFRTASWFMLGASFAMACQLVRAHDRYGSASTINLHRRVSSNLQTQSLLRSMQHHLMTRQMPLSDVLNR
jgi:hypothetical protein